MRRRRFLILPRRRAPPGPPPNVPSHVLIPSWAALGIVAGIFILAVCFLVLLARRESREFDKTTARGDSTRRRL